MLKKGGWTALHYTAIHSNFEVFKFIFENAKNKNPIDEFGRTPLHFAVVWNRLEICKLIIANVENPNLGDNFGKTPQSFARNKEIIKLFEN